MIQHQPQDLCNMRPLHCKSSGIMEFEDDPDGDIPEYAALSWSRGIETEMKGIQDIHYPCFSSLTMFLELSWLDAGNKQSSTESSALDTTSGTPLPRKQTEKSWLILMRELLERFTILYVDAICINQRSFSVHVPLGTMTQQNHQNASPHDEEPYSECFAFELSATVPASRKRHDLKVHTDRTPLGSSSTCSKTSLLHVLGRMFVSIPTNAYQAAVSFIWRNDDIWNL